MNTKKISLYGNKYMIEYNERQEPVRITEFNFDGLQMSPAVRVIWKGDSKRPMNDLVRNVLEKSKRFV